MRIKVLILGATGMFGHVIFKRLFKSDQFEVKGTVRGGDETKLYFTKDEINSLIPDVDADNFDSILKAFRLYKPDIVINCIGIIKQLPSSHLKCIYVNALFPHKLANLCEIVNARLIHISTDCVFNGKKGSYIETDVSDAEDIYGRTKFLGEVEYQHVITLRTSIIGHELKSNIALVDWFLHQEKAVKGYSKAIYSGLTTYELSNVIQNYVIPNKSLNGLYHVAAEKITKYQLLNLINQIYKKFIDIEEFPNFLIDRSLISNKFKEATGYSAPTWIEMLDEMYKYHNDWDCYRLKF